MKNTLVHTLNYGPPYLPALAISREQAGRSPRHGGKLKGGYQNVGSLL